MAAAWQDLVIQQAELLSDRLRELLSAGLGLLRSELGLDIGVKPELYPTWVILLTAFIGLLVIVWFWVAACGSLFGGKKLSVRESNGEESTETAVIKADKTEEQKKKSKKKNTEKKAQPNGRTVVDQQEDTVGNEENLTPFPVEVKTEKSKKNKKKTKTEVKPTKTGASTDGKEPEGSTGSWETKVSNREKRQQRKKDKPSDESGSPGGGDPPASAPVEQPRPAVPAGQRKSKGEAQRSKAGKGEAIISQVSASWSESSALNGGGWNDMAMKLPAQTPTPDAESWSAAPKATSHRSAEAPTRGQDVEGSRSGGDQRMKTDRNPASFTPLGLGEQQSVSNLQWDSQPAVPDEWSGLNGMQSDPGSDWNAPSELWGNFEEPQPECPAPPPKESAPEAKGSEDEKEKGDDATGGSGKPKKKKKKKKQEDAGGSQDSREPEKETSATSQASKPPVKEKVRPVPAKAPAPETRPERPDTAPDNISQKPSTQVPPRLAEPESTAKQNNVPAPAQKKHDENWESPKQVKKKKARRET